MALIKLEGNSGGSRGLDLLGHRFPAWGEFRASGPGF